MDIIGLYDYKMILNKVVIVMGKNDTVRTNIYLVILLKKFNYS